MSTSPNPLRQPPSAISVCSPFVAVVLLVILGAPSQCWGQQVPQKFLKTYCLDCHNQSDASGDREFETLRLTSHDQDTQIALQEIIDQLTLGSMPPEEADQPPSEERLAAIRQLTERLQQMREQDRGASGQTVLRRLSRREYRNTMRDLLGIDMTMFDPTAHFPSDFSEHGFDTLGESLVTSSYLLENYLRAADQCIEKAFAVTSEPDVQTWKFNDQFYQQPELAAAHQRSFENRYLSLYDHPLNDKPEGAYGWLKQFRQGVPVDGIYEIRILAEAKHRDTPYSQKSITLDRDEKFRVGVVPGDTRIGDMYHVQPIQPKLAEAVIEDDQPQWYTFEVPLAQHFAPRFTFENGIHNVRSSYGRLYRFDKQHLPEKILKERGIYDQRIALIRHGKIPHIRIHEVEIRGPIKFSWPTEARRKLYQGPRFNPQSATATLDRFLQLAYRRPPTDQETERWIQLYQHRLDAGRQPELAIQDTFKAILCSPSFLYFQTPPEGSSTLSDFAIAERLSYFLTGSMPDDELFLLAEQGMLQEPDQRRRQVQRLLAKQTRAGKASDDFVSGFLDNWLNLHSLGSMPPDPMAFREYFSRGLEPEMKQETRIYFQDLLDRNASAIKLLDSDYTFANGDLASLYGVKNQIPDNAAHLFHKVTFEDRLRGGLLGQASVLTVSANGIETSPVTRGVWILNNILGTPPPPPPDDVPALDPDTRGATTIRDLLKRHRSDPACNDCHRKIDPLGFAMECFDPIGKARQRYPNKTSIDVSGKLPNGQSFSGPGELKQRLLEQRVFFARNLTSRLFEYALGRKMDASDRAAIDQVLKATESKDYPLRSLIEEIVASKLFAGG